MSTENTTVVGDPTQLGVANAHLENCHRWYLQHVAPHVIDHAGQYDGKYRAPVSQSTHFINAAFIGLGVYAYDTVVRTPGLFEEDEARMILAALTLHDANKFVGAHYDVDIDTDRNSRAVLEHYFEDDLFNVAQLLPGTVDDHFDDLLYLIQRTETGEDARETRDVEPNEYAGLEVYCELGDAVASAISVDGIEDGADRLRRHYIIDDESPVNVLRLTPVEQPLLHAKTQDAVKAALKGGDEPDGLILGSTMSAILYLGNPVDPEALREPVLDSLKETIGECDFTCKADWQSLDYKAVGDVDFDLDEKRDIVASTYITEVLEEGNGLDQPVEAVPDGFADPLPELVNVLYNTDDYEFTTDALATLYNQLQEDVSGQKVKVEMMRELAVNFDEYEDALAEEAAAARDLFEDAVTPETSAVEAVVDRVLNPDPDFTSAGDPMTADTTCFLCGARAETPYKPGDDALFKARGFSKRVDARQDAKRICQTCSIEYALFEDRCGHLDVSTANTVNTAYFRFGDFIPDVHYHHANLSANQLFNSETIDWDATPTPQLSAELLGRQVHIQPFDYSHKNRKLQVVRRLLQRVQNTGMRLTIGQPLAEIEIGDAVALDTEPLDAQRIFHADRIDSFADLDRPLALFDVVSAIDSLSSRENEDQFLMLNEDSFLELATTADDRLAAPGKLDLLIEYITTYHHDEFMSMKRIAEAGIDLYGTQYGSKHAKTDPFRTALDRILHGLTQDFDESELRTFVAGEVYSIAERKKWAGRVTRDQAHAFTNAIFDYLTDNDLLSIGALSDWEDPLVDAYRIAYEDAVEAADADDDANEDDTPTDAASDAAATDTDTPTDASTTN